MRIDLGQIEEAAKELYIRALKRLPPDVKARLTKQLESFDEGRLMAAFDAARSTDRVIKSHGYVEARLEEEIAAMKPHGKG